MELKSMRQTKQKKGVDIFQLIKYNIHHYAENKDQPQHIAERRVEEKGEARVNNKANWE